MKYHLVFKDTNAIFRPANHGITDTEWEHGCRTLWLDGQTEYSARGFAEISGYELLSKEEWSEFISSLDDPSVTSNDHYINSRPRPDKWDNSREIY